ncbi:acyltransferase domain-containing protein [Reyranella sp.]|uniref:acyltransferase domain-containing protein n=1 Tax=Reyranella sp. TaxID=1929291 RepID=UPI003D0FAB0E
MTLALLCSGQGRQHRDMFALAGDAPEAAGLFAHAARLLGGRDPRELVRRDSDEALHANRTGQILCTLEALGAAAALRDALPDRLVVAGYSVGEVAGWGVAGLFSPTDTLDLVARRAEIMDAVSPAGDGLLFVRGLPHAVIDGLCERHDAAVAIVNPGNGFVLGGNRAALVALAEDAKALNAVRVVDVAVNVASHTKRLATASATYREVLSHVAVAPPAPGRRIISGIDGAPVLDVQAGLDKLAGQISHTLQWADCLQGCVEAGATAFLELGPGRALSDMIAGARCLEEFRTLEGSRAWLRALPLSSGRT